jgi:hypothetical protein
MDNLPVVRGKYSSEALKGISAKRAEDAKALFKMHVAAS